MKDRLLQVRVSERTLAKIKFIQYAKEFDSVAETVRSAIDELYKESLIMDEDQFHDFMYDVYHSENGEYGEPDDELCIVVMDVIREYFKPTEEKSKKLIEEIKKAKAERDAHL